MADIDRATYAYECLKDAARSYAQIGPEARGRYIKESALIAIGHYLKLLVDSEVQYGGDGNVKPRPHTHQTYPSR